MQPSIKDDFYTNINFDWITKTIIPVHLSSVNFYVIRREETSKILENIIKNSTSHLGNYYRSGMTQNREMDGIKKIFLAINRINTKKEFIKILASLNKLYISNPINVSITVDSKSSNQYRVNIHQGGIGLPKSFFNDTEICKKYKSLIYEVFVYFLDGEDFDKSLIDDIFNIESLIASYSLTPEEEMDPEATYNLFCKDQLNENIQALITECGIVINNDVIIESLSYLNNISTLIENTSINILKTYLIWCTIRSLTEHMSLEIEEIFFKFYGTILHGIKEQKPQSERIVNATKKSLADLLDIEYKKLKTVNQDDVAYIQKMINLIKTEYEKILNNLSWMSSSTKTIAIKKLRAIQYKIGYPNNFETFDGLAIGDNYLQNYLNINLYYSNKIINKYNENKCVDKDKWPMKSYEVNACYIPTSNEMIIPAGILQAPFYSANQTNAQNFAGIGAIIGHEIVHAFDVHGSRFNESGDMNEWWTKIDHALYMKKSQKLINQYNNYGINGKLTLGENFADIIGFYISYSVFTSKYTTDKDKKEFIEHHALCSCEKVTPEKLKMQIETNPHAPEKFRINGVMSNLDEFYSLYNVKPGDKMYIPKENRFNFL